MLAVAGAAPVVFSVGGGDGDCCDLRPFDKCPLGARPAFMKPTPSMLYIVYDDYSDRGLGPLLLLLLLNGPATAHPPHLMN